MKIISPKYSLLSVATFAIAVMIFAMPFHAFLTVWGSSAAGHYTLLRLWKEFLLFGLVIICIYFLIIDKHLSKLLFGKKITWLIVAYSLVNVVWGLVALANNSVSEKALGFALIVNVRFLIFFLVVWTVSLKTNWLKTNWPRLIIWPALAVVVIGVLQIFILPRDFLQHFGYSLQTIPPYETINHNQSYVRIISTLRGANPLGAYMLIPITALSVLWLKFKNNLNVILALACSLAVLFFSFSRSAWIGLLVSYATIFWVKFKGWTSFTNKLVLLVVLILVALTAIGFQLRHNAKLENVLLHTQTHSLVKTTSNQGHLSALKSGLSDLYNEPLGRGPGSAGPASVYNNHPARISENYFIQIGQETGWVGLALFLFINAEVAILLWQKRQQPLALILLASFAGISLVNMLSHAWTDDTLAYVWWGLAGITISGTGAKNAKNS